MSTSTIESRRELRQEQRDINDALFANREKLSEAGGSQLLAVLRARNDDAFRRVDHARESLNDVMNLRELARASHVQSERLNESAFGYDFEAFAKGLQTQYIDRADASAEFHWARLGRDAGALFCCAPATCTLRGGLVKPVKQRVMSERAVKEHAETVKPINVAHDAAAKDAGPIVVEATNERVNVMYKSFHGTCQRSEVDLMDFLVDGQDPVQTVENFFDFGFMVKNKRVVMKADEAGRPRCKEMDPNMMDRQPSSQVILSLRMSELKALKGFSLGVCPLHREDALYQAVTALQQAKILEDRDKSSRCVGVKAARDVDSGSSNCNSANSKKRPRPGK